MSPLVVLAWVGLVVTWLAVTAGIWAMLTDSGARSAGSGAAPNE